MNKDTASTLTGGGAGLLLLNSVHWESVPWGEFAKVIVGLVLIVAGYLAYRGQPE